MTGPARRTFRLHYSIPRSSFSFLDHRVPDTGAFQASITSLGDPMPTIVVIGDRKESWRGHPVHVGLLAQVDVPADHLFSARAHAAAVLDGVLSMISVQANAPADEPFLEYGHETTQGVSELEYVQIHRFQGALFQRKRVLEMPAVERLIEQSLKTPDDARVGRAFRWYRKGFDGGGLAR